MLVILFLLGKFKGPVTHHRIVIALDKHKSYIHKLTVTLILHLFSCLCIFLYLFLLDYLIIFFLQPMILIVAWNRLLNLRTTSNRNPIADSLNSVVHGVNSIITLERIVWSRLNIRRTLAANSTQVGLYVTNPNESRFLFYGFWQFCLQFFEEWEWELDEWLFKDHELKVACDTAREGE